MSNIILQDGQPIFVGKEDPENPPVRPVGESSKMECEKCGSMVDYLLGDKHKVCEACFDPSKDQLDLSNETDYDKTKEIL